MEDENKSRFKHLRARSEMLRNRVHHWSQITIGALVGTVPSSPGTRFLRALEDGRMFLRCEHQALAGLLIAKGVITQAEYIEALSKEYEIMLAALESQHPGVRATDSGVHMDVEEIVKAGWQKDWPP